jgi:hypothetical protein
VTDQRDQLAIAAAEVEDRLDLLGQQVLDQQRFGAGPREPAAREALAIPWLARAPPTRCRSMGGSCSISKSIHDFGDQYRGSVPVCASDHRPGHP